jgi:hypothetical protein
MILLDGQPAVRLYVQCWGEGTRRIDIARLPRHGGSGLGTSLLLELQGELRSPLPGSEGRQVKMAS